MKGATIFPYSRYHMHSRHTVPSESKQGRDAHPLRIAENRLFSRQGWKVFHTPSAPCSKKAEGWKTPLIHITSPHFPDHDAAAEESPNHTASPARLAANLFASPRRCNDAGYYPIQKSLASILGSGLNKRVLNKSQPRRIFGTYTIKRIGFVRIPLGRWRRVVPEGMAEVTGEG